MRIVIVVAAAMVIAAMISVLAYRALPNLPALDESDYGGKVHLVPNHDAGRLYVLGAFVDIDFTAKPRVKIEHPAGLAEGSVRTEGRRMVITIEKVDGQPVAEWGKQWPAIRSKLIAERVRRAGGHPRPNDLDLALRKVRNEQEAIRALEEAEYNASLLNPFDQPWEWEISATGDWTPLTPLTPKMR